MIKVMFLRLAPWMGVVHPHPQDALYAFDVAQVAAFLSPHQYEVIFIDGLVEKISINTIIERIISIKPDVLALTATSSAGFQGYEIFRLVKESLPEIYLIGFGQHAHYSPQDFLNPLFQIDACVYGECELTLLELIKETPRTEAQKSQVKGIYYWAGQLQKTPERPLTMDIDLWPMPRYEIFKNRNHRIVSLNFPAFRNVRPGWVLASRGCYYECTICSPAIRRSFGTALRKSSPERVADTFEFLKSNLGVNTICFGDDTFSLDMQWAQDICDELIKRKNNIQWGMSTRADRLTSKLIKKMKAAGLRAAAIGVESGSKRILEDINKKITHEQIEWAISELGKNKICVNVTAIVGHVDETEEELKQTLAFLRKIKPFFVQLHYLSPYPGTKVADVFKDKIRPSQDISHYNSLPINVSKIPDDIFAGVIQNFYLEYYSSWKFIQNYIKYRLLYVMRNPVKEIVLIRDALAYFLLSRKYRKPNNNHDLYDVQSSGVT